MAITAYPKAGVGTSVTQWSDYHEPYLGSCVAGSADFGVTANGAALKVSIGPGFGWVRSVAFHDPVASELTFSPGPSTAGQSRIDTVIARLDHSQTPVVQLAVKIGVPGAAPVPPALVQDRAGIWEMPLADVLLGTNALAITADKVSNRRVDWMAGMRARIGLFVQPSTPTGFRDGVWIKKA